jgi:hypothetical protein
VNVVPLTPIPLHSTLVTEVPAGKLALSKAAVPEQRGPIVVKFGAGAAATVIVIEPVTRQPLTVALKVTTYVPKADGAVNVVPLTPSPLQSTLVTVVPSGNVALRVLVVPGHNVPIEPKTGAGTVATVMVLLAVIEQPFTVALKSTV